MSSVTATMTKQNLIQDLARTLNATQTTSDINVTTTAPASGVEPYARIPEVVTAFAQPIMLRQRKAEEISLSEIPQELSMPVAESLKNAAVEDLKGKVAVWDALAKSKYIRLPKNGRNAWTQRRRRW